MHTSVLLQESIDGLDVQPGDVALDATLGGVGHAKEIVERLGPSGTFVGIDEDSAAIQRAKVLLENQKTRVVLKQSNFRYLDRVLQEAGITAINRAVFDLGLSSFELEESGRGFSFQKNEPLVMTFSDSPSGVTAYDVVNTWEEENLADIIFGFGGERYSRRIAEAIARGRENAPIKTSGELAEIVSGAVPVSYRRGRLHPATRTFQAIRMAVNDELGALKEALPKAWEVLRPGGRIAVISFHEHEDRIVKHYFVEKVKYEGARVVSKKPIVPSAAEMNKNPRSRSAKLRIIEK